LERRRRRDVFLDGGAEELAVDVPDGHEVVRGGSARHLDQHRDVALVLLLLLHRLVHQVRVPFSRIHRPQDHRFLNEQIKEVDEKKRKEKRIAS